MDAAGNVFVSDSYYHLVVKISTSGVLTVVAGNGIAGFSGDGGPATSAGISNPLGVAVDAAGNLYIAQGERVRKVNTAGIITTVAGGGSNVPGDGGPATSAQFSFTPAVAVDAAGNLYLSEDRQRIRKVDLGGTITTVAGNGVAGFSGDGGPGLSASIGFPFGLAVDAAGNL